MFVRTRFGLRGIYVKALMFCPPNRAHYFVKKTSRCFGNLLFVWVPHGRVLSTTVEAEQPLTERCQPGWAQCHADTTKLLQTPLFGSDLKTPRPHDGDSHSLVGWFSWVPLNSLCLSQASFLLLQLSPRSYTAWSNSFPSALNSKDSNLWERLFKAGTCTPTFTMHINKYSLFKFCTLRFNILHPKHFANGCLLCKILYSAHCHSVQNYRYNITLPLVCFL